MFFAYNYLKYFGILSIFENYHTCGIFRAIIGITFFIYVIPKSNNNFLIFSIYQFLILKYVILKLLFCKLIESVKFDKICLKWNPQSELILNVLHEVYDKEYDKTYHQLFYFYYYFCF